MKAIRVGVGGFLCETDTLAPTKASYDDFERESGWPAMARGSGALAATPGANVAMSSFVAAAEARGWELAPTLWCAANPGAQVREQAYERVVTEIVAATVGWFSPSLAARPCRRADQHSFDAHA